MIGRPFAGRRERLRREASRWIARLHGPDDGEQRAAFEEWYRADPEHAAAYDRLAALFEAAGGIRPGAAPARSRPQLGHPYAFSAAVAGACFAGIIGAVVVGSQVASSPAAGVQSEVFRADGQAGRSIRLADGSDVLLAPASELRVDITPDGRRLQLRQGMARFKVFHDGRSFVVTARDAEVVARGTQFVVRLGERETLVSLIEGEVDVYYPALSGRSGKRRTALRPGQRLTVPAQPAQQREPAPVPTSRSAMIDFDDVELADALDRVNTSAGPQIRLARPSLARLRVTGAFQTGDAPGFARSVALALGLRVEQAPDGTLWLSRAGTEPLASNISGG